MLDMARIKDPFTLDNLVMPGRGVTPAKVKAVEGWVIEGMRGGKGAYLAEARLKEALMSGDLASSVAHYINLITIPQLPDLKQRPIGKIVGTPKSVPDFRPATLFGLGFGKLEGPGIIEADTDFVGSAPRVPQGTPYPVATISGVEAAYGKLAKRGLRINWDFEDFVNDTVGVLDTIPGELQQVALQTEWREIGDALVGATGTAYASVVLPDTTTVPANAPVSANAIMGGIRQLALARVHGNLIGTLSGYNVIVPVGEKVMVDFDIRKALGITAILPALSTGGPVTVGPDNSVLGNVEVIEHESVTGTNWALLPKPGAYSRPVMDLLHLRGYETPQVRYKADAAGEGFSFDSDSAALRLRLITGAVVWFNEAILKSTGAGS